MKILIVGLNYAPEPVGIGPYTSGMAECLAAAGHHVEVVAGEPYYPAWRRYPDAPRRIRTREHGVWVRRCRHFIPSEPTGFKRVLHHASFALTALAPALATALRVRPDLVFTVTPSLLSVPTAWLAARASGARLWTHVQDFEVEAAFATGLMSDGKLAGRLARTLEARLLRLADRVSTISPQMVDRLAGIGIPPASRYQLRNWANSGFAPDPAGAARYRQEWGIGSRKVALYAGSISNKQGIGIIVEAARKLRHRDDLVFAICGQGPGRERLVVECAELPNVQLHGLQPADRMGGLLALADIHLLPQISGAGDLVLPSKLSNILSSRRPVVATAEPGTGLASEVAGCGIVTTPGDAEAFAQAVARLADDAELAARLGQAGGQRAREHWSQREIIHRLEAEFGKLLRTCEPPPDRARPAELPLR